MIDMGFLSDLLKYNSITEEGIRNYIAYTGTKRICFSRIQKKALRKTRKGNYYKKLSQEEYEKAKYDNDDISLIPMELDIVNS